MAGEKIIMGTGVVYFGDVGNYNIATSSDGLLPFDGEAVTSSMVSTAPTVAGGWTQVSELGKEGFVFAPGNQVQLIEQANSLWPIDARQIRNAGAFTLTLLNADIQTIYQFGVGEVGVDRQRVAPQSSADGVDSLTFRHNDGPEQSIAGISILFDGFGAGFNQTGKRARRRIWIPRAIQTAPLALAQSDLAPTTIVGQFSIALSDEIRSANNTNSVPAPGAWMADLLPETGS